MDRLTNRTLSFGIEALSLAAVLVGSQACCDQEHCAGPQECEEEGGLEAQSGHFLQWLPVDTIAVGSSRIWAAHDGNGVFSQPLDGSPSYFHDGVRIDANAVYPDTEHDMVFAATSGGVYWSFDEGASWNHVLWEPYENYWVRSLGADTDRMWVGTGGDLHWYTYETASWSSVNIGWGSYEWQAGMVAAILVEEDKVWFGNDYGLQVYDKTAGEITNAATRTHYSAENGAFESSSEVHSVNCIARDSDGALWIGTDEWYTTSSPDYANGGLFRWDGASTWDWYTTADGLPANGIWDLALEGRRVWVATFAFDPDARSEDAAGLAVLDRDTGVARAVLARDTPLLSDDVRTVEVSQGLLFVGSDVGVQAILPDDLL